MAAQNSHRPLLLCLGMLAFALLLPDQAKPQSAGANVPTQSTTGETPINEPAKPAQKELVAGPVKATVTVLRSNRPFPVGGAAFARIELSNKGKAAHATADLHLESATAEIRSVTGPKIEVSGDGNTRTVTIGRIQKLKPTIVLVELALGAETAGKPNALNVQLRSAGSEDAKTRFSWDVTDCAGDYYAHIVRVRKGSGSSIADAMEAARKRDATRPGHWLFPPSAVSARKGGKCLKSVRRWNRRRGRYVYICTQYEKRETDITITSVPFEKRVYNFASRFVRSRAVDRELAPTRDSGWATTRISKNLQGFLSQEKHPAICTGSLEYFDYFGKRMQGFLQRAKTFDDMAAKSYALALLRTVEAVEVSKTDSGGHPGWGASPLLPAAGQTEISLKQMTEILAQMTGDPGTADQAESAAGTFAALQTIAQKMKETPGDVQSDVTRKAMKTALGAVEAADYIGTVATHYADLRHALAGSIADLRKAHAASCNCSG